MFSNFSCQQLAITRCAYVALLEQLENDPRNCPDFMGSAGVNDLLSQIDTVTCLIARIDAEKCRKCRIAE